MAGGNVVEVLGRATRAYYYAHLSEIDPAGTEFMILHADCLADAEHVRDEIKKACPQVGRIDISSLGVNIIYLSPVFEAYSNHKYYTGDYEKVDPMFGGDKALDLLIKEAKKRGILI